VIVLDDVHVKWPGKTQWLLERWAELHPLTIGPFGILRKESPMNAVFTRVHPAAGTPDKPIHWNFTQERWA
jgi:hypothetical protein